MDRRGTSFFRGSELPRLLALVAIVVVGLLAFWQFGRNPPPPPAPPLRAGEPPKPVEPDRSLAFEGVTDRKPISLRDSAAYDLLLKRARGLTPEKLAAESRRDILLTHLWERPARYRGVPIHLDGTALRVLRYESKLSRTGWLYEAWIETEDSGRYPYACVFEEAPKGFPIGANVSERVVFNGYFLKIMAYEAGDVARGAPLLVGRIGWDASRSAELAQPGSGSTLRWTLILLMILIFASFLRWIGAFGRMLGGRGRPSSRSMPVNDQIDAAALAEWVQQAGKTGGESPGDPAAGVGSTEGLPPAAENGAQPPDEASSSSSPIAGR